MKNREEAFKLAIKDLLSELSQVDEEFGALFEEMLDEYEENSLDSRLNKMVVTGSKVLDEALRRYLKEYVK